MAHTTQPPPSPTKRQMLKSFLPSLPSAEASAQSRWATSQTKQQTTQPRPAPLASNANGRVASMIQGFEAASLGSSSRPSAASVPLAASPTKRSYASPKEQPAPIHARFTAQRPTVSTNASSAPAPKAQVSPTVPASLFQSQQSSRAPSQHSAHAHSSQPVNQARSPVATTAPAAFSPTAHVNEKENRGPFVPRQISSPTQARSTAGGGVAPSRASSHQHSHSTGERLSAAQLARLQVADNIRAPHNKAQPTMSEVSVETMATRSSDSTHASSIVTALTNDSKPSSSGASSAMHAVVSQARQIDVPSSRAAQPQPVRQQSAPVPQQNPAPATLQRSVRPSHARAPPSQRSPVGSSFVESLPASYPSAAPPASAPAPMQPHLTTYSSDRSPALGYERLPMESEAQATLSSTPRRPTRARAVTLSGGLQSPVRRPNLSSSAEASKPIETAEEKKRRIEAEFEKLLDTLQVPDPTVRNKMMALALPVKEGMLLNSSTRSLGASGSSVEGKSAGGAAWYTEQRPTGSGSSGGNKQSSKAMRKTKSSTSLRPSSGDSDKESKRPGHSRTSSATSLLLRSFGRSSGKKAQQEQQYAGERSPNLSDDGGKDNSSASQGQGPSWWAARISNTAVRSLNPKEIGKLRGRLRNEPPAWVEEFLNLGGYDGMSDRLKELLSTEWREEQHDDQVLHHLLRCFKALTLTPAGRKALASDAPFPFLNLAGLLWSEKRPGDLPARQLLVELIQSLFVVQPEGVQPVTDEDWAEVKQITDDDKQIGATSQQSNSNNTRRFSRPATSREQAHTSFSNVDDSDRVTPARQLATFHFVHSLMLGPPSAKERAKVDFIQQTHRARVFKVWATELCEVLRDYFWVFCHAQNPLWTREQLDEERIETPKVPSGMTGGVEAEAMAYATAHFRLLNALLASSPGFEASFAIHTALFQSGFERVILTFRRASATYYQALHLEMARYVSLARKARFNLGPRVLGWIDQSVLGEEERGVVRVWQEKERERVRAQTPQLELNL